MNRIRELDALRGLAALAVVLHHGLFQTGAVWEGRVKLLADSPALVFVLGRPFVVLFFVLSGFVLSRSLSAAPSLKVFGVWSAQRAVRLIVPAFGSVVLSAVLYHFAFSGTWSRETFWLRYVNWTKPPGLNVLLSEGLLLDAPTLNNVLWSLVIEVRVTLLIPLMVWFAASRDKQVILLLLATGLCSLVGGSTPNSLGYGDDALLNLQTLVYFVFPFVLGVVLERSRLYAIQAGPLMQAAVLFALLGFARAATDIAACLGAALLIWLVQQPGAIRATMRAPLLTWFGKISFSLYLVHVPVLDACFHLFHDRYPRTLIAAGAITAAIPVAWLFYLVLERPSHHLARLIRPRSASVARLGQQVVAPR